MFFEQKTMDKPNHKEKEQLFTTIILKSSKVVLKMLSIRTPNFDKNLRKIWDYPTRPFKFGFKIAELARKKLANLKHQPTVTAMTVIA